MRAIQNFHMDSKGWLDIAYSFCVDDDGSIYEGRGFGVVGGHTAGHNSISHAICFMGNFQNRQPTPESLAAANWLVNEGIRRGAWTRVTGGHRDASGASTACPGQYLEARIPEIASNLPTPGPTPTAPASEPEPLEDEMDYRVIYLTDNKTVAWLHNSLSGLTYRLGSLDEAKFYNGLGVPSVWVADSTVENAIQASAR